MCHFEPAFLAERGESVVRVHPQIAGVRTHIPGNEAGCVECVGIGIFDGSDVVGLDPQFALYVEKRLAHRRALTAHHVAKPYFVVVKPFWSDVSVLFGIAL